MFVYQIERIEIYTTYIYIGQTSMIYVAFGRALTQTPCLRAYLAATIIVRQYHICIL